MKTNPDWKDWFVLSKRDRNAFIILLAVCISYSLILIFYQPHSGEPVIKNLDEELAQLSPQNGDSAASQPDLFTQAITASSSATETPQLFYFDPNTLDESGFQRLGLREKTIHTIINYRSKGGHFYKPDDLRKIYGLKEEEANQLVAYVRINSSQAQSDFVKQNKNNTESKPYFTKSKLQVIDINTATVEQWKSLPAIGDVLSERIVKYRDARKGFTSVEDVKKVYGLSDSTYQIILPYLTFSTSKSVTKTEVATTSSSKKININTASVNDLKSNPVISSDIAEAIIIYRRQHGNYSSVEGIKKIIFINDELYHKIAPYLTVE